MSRIVESAIETVQGAESAFCKFISANDVGKTKTGTTKSHQSGFYIPIKFCDIVFETEIKRNQNYKQPATIEWQQNAITTNSIFNFYGSKNECHLTNFGKGFPFKQEENLGDLLVIAKISKDYYKAFILSTDEDFDEFFAALNITANDTNRPIAKVEVANAESELLNCFLAFVSTLNKRFPSTADLSKNARECYNTCYGITDKRVKANPDLNLLNWLNAEYQLFKAIENDVYSDLIKAPFESVEQLIVFANTLLNRRKSRAGKSLEFHLEEVFERYGLDFTTQAITEDNKKPDFIFPNIEAYRNPAFDEKKLILLASKTTCKDRWRQVINEADRIKTKHLFTLQQGISKNQLTEMYNQGVHLVVPKKYLNTFPAEFRDRISTLDSFIQFAQLKQ
jgi:type II restriction enzyme